MRRALSLRVGSLGFFLGLPLDVRQEAVVCVRNQVQAAWFAILFKFGAHLIEGLFLISGHLWVVKKHAVLLPNEVLKEVVDVALCLQVRVQLTIDTESSSQGSIRFVSALDLVRGQVLHLLLQLLVIGLEDNRVLWQDLLRDDEARE